MNKLVQAMSKQENQTFTENGMKIKKSSENAVVDLFFAVGALRGNTDRVRELFTLAFNENQDLALRVALYARDAREGMGERESFRAILNQLAMLDYKVALKIIPLVPELGRWDDLFAFVGTPAEREALNSYAMALEKGHPLAAKWAPREKSAKSAWAGKLRAVMGLSSKEYRKTIVELTNVVEQQMSSGSWGKIEFSHVPSVAAARYQSAFLRNDEARYRDYLNKLTKGDESVKINAGAVYPHDIYRSMVSGNEQAASAQWKALPDWIPEGKSFLPMIDVSGSMQSVASGSTTCMDVSVSLGLYCAQKNKGMFKDTFITFSENPTFQNVSGLTLKQAFRKTRQSEWGMTTNIELAFIKLLELAKKNKVPQDHMPDMVLILSDMQFNRAVCGPNNINANIKQQYKEAGYSVPDIVYWNLRDCGSNTPVSFDKEGVALVSGFSPSIMKSVMSSDFEQFTPINIVLSTVMVDRYNWQ